MHQIEIVVNLWFQGLGKWLLIPMQLFSFLGTQYFLILLMAWIYWNMDSRIGFRLAVALVFGNISNLALKWIFHAPRPYWVNTDVKPLSVEGSFGIPSGHAMMSTIFYGRVAVFVRKRWVTVLSSLTILLIGISRIYLGVHFLSDVVAGYCFGIGLLLVLNRFEKQFAHWIIQKPLWIQIMIFFISSLLFIALFITLNILLKDWQIPETWANNVRSLGIGSSINPMRMVDVFTLTGLWFGMLSGYAWLKKNIRYQCETKLELQLIRYLAGLAGLGLITLLYEIIIKSIFNEILNAIFVFLSYTFLSIWITAAAPWIFVKIGLAKKKE